MTEMKDKILKWYFLFINPLFYIDLIAGIPFCLLILHPDEFAQKFLFALNLLRYWFIFECLNHILAYFMISTHGDLSRFIKLNIILFMLVQVFSSLYILAGSLSGEVNWINNLNKSQVSEFTVYVEAVFFVIYTITTVGYGDKSVASNTLEVFTSLIIIIVGSMYYSYLIGFLAKICGNIW